ncbi:DNA-binding NarL/FixJ family response regulator [Inquilinus ginsengisoli]|jgi:DNA-binding NarL/FixJ family response regulator|uniref:DNA-binding NarL/FixJ family response regulator n=1 Tax=Inquilinus ginsengisoli TaxID=363840 RepID=A0ABU1JWV0_9PROT|nr:response regulator transcription factor [Inquilinus ginsengisoli]MDR6293102.1 DNA-binding NarL/FixJ family response regulator [Inquilinus ginsengisoli]
MLFNENGADALPGATKMAEPEIDLIAKIRAAERPGLDLIVIAIIDRRALGRETLTRALASTDSRFLGRAFADIREWEQSPDRSDTSLILLEDGAVGDGDPSFKDELHGLVSTHPDIPVIVIGENEDPHYVAEILEQGARGYIPTSVSLSVAIGALCLALVGGVFVPASAFQKPGHARPERQQPAHSMFGLSERQAAVASAVALGKPNKIIAYELDLCESTVKVHIRSIMKKLQARNRTEIAFKLHAAKIGPLPSRRVRPVGACAA